MKRLENGRKKCDDLQSSIESLRDSTSKKGISQLEREKKQLEADLDHIIESLSKHQNDRIIECLSICESSLRSSSTFPLICQFPGGIQQKLKGTLVHWKKFEDELEAHTKWFRAVEAAFRDQQLKDTLDEKQTQLNNYKQKRNDITEREAQIDQFVDESHALLNTSGVDRIKPLISQISNRLVETQTQHPLDFIYLKYIFFVYWVILRKSQNLAVTLKTY